MKNYQVGGLPVDTPEYEPSLNGSDFFSQSLSIANPNPARFLPGQIHSKLGAINVPQACPRNPTACESGIDPHLDIKNWGRSRSTQVSKNTSLFLLRVLDFHP